MLMVTLMFCVAYLISDIAYALLNPAHPRRRTDGNDRRPETAAELPRRPPTGSGARSISPGGGSSPTRRRWSAASCSLILILAAIFAPLITKTDPTQQAFLTQALAFPSWEFWFGVDDLGRDFFTRIVYGARVSLTHRLCRGGLQRR